MVECIVLALLCLIPAVGYIREKKAWNGGRCRECGYGLRQFDTDSQGGRMYKCANPETTHYGPDISYPGIDR